MARTRRKNHVVVRRPYDTMHFEYRPELIAIGKAADVSACRSCRCFRQPKNDKGRH